MVKVLHISIFIAYCFLINSSIISIPKRHQKAADESRMSVEYKKKKHKQHLRS